MSDKLREFLGKIRNRVCSKGGLIVLLAAVFALIFIYDAIAIKISALATLLVALAAYGSIQENRRIRRDSVERESRDRKERLIEEVARWLRELEGNIFPSRGRVMDAVPKIRDSLKASKGIGFKEWLSIGEIDLDIVALNNIYEAVKEADYYKKVTLKIDVGLSESIVVVMDKMTELAELLDEDITYRRNCLKKGKGGKKSADKLPKGVNGSSEKSGSNGEDIFSERIERNTKALRASIREAVDKVIELKESFIEGS